MSYLKRTVKRTAWPVGRFKRAGVGNPTRHDLRAVARVLGPFWAVGLFPWTVCLFPWAVDRFLCIAHAAAACPQTL